MRVMGEVYVVRGGEGVVGWLVGWRFGKGVGREGKR